MTDAKCEICGEPMQDGEEMFKFHGSLGPCPKPPLPKPASVVVTFTDKEADAVKALAAEQDMSEAAVGKQAIRLYQLVHERMKQGETFSFSGDLQRARDFAGLAESTPQGVTKEG